MSRVIGRTKSWVWWIAGTLCALIFGAAARAGEMAARYGVPARPAPPVESPEVTDGQQQKVEKLLDDYLAPPAAGTPSAEQKAAVEKLLKDFSSADFKTREDASAQAAKQGTAALGLLREAAKAKDPEVASRAEAAAAAIENSARQVIVDELRKIQGAALQVLNQKIAESRDLQVMANANAAAADKAGNAAEAAKTREEAARQAARTTTLSALSAQIQPVRKGGGGMVPVYGIRPQLERD